MKQTTPLVASVALLLSSALIAAPAHANGSDSSVIDISGTSDMSDSGFIQYLTPKFLAAYPQYSKVNYLGKATGVAISNAKSGNYDAVIVHAASVENQFVADGWSKESFGRAIFWGDFVLLGPASDPAGVMSAGAASHSVTTAFQRIAAAGADRKAHFVSRLWSGAAGTTVQEHKIWAATGVTGCKVSETYGGGTMPSTNAASDGSCAANPAFPDWYESGDRAQGANVQFADECASAYVSSTPDCYVLTDRGTYANLAGQGKLSSLKIAVANPAVGAAGYDLSLVNSFHAYAVNPAKFDSSVAAKINSQGATDFLNWITSPAGQAAAEDYLSGAVGGAPFLPSAAPVVTLTSPLPASVAAGRPFTIAGRLANVVPGTPALSGVTVSLRAVTVGTTAPPVVATARTDAAGAFSISYTPTARLVYTLTTDQITQVEDASLSPTFSDLLQPTSTVLGAPSLVAAVVTSAKIPATLKAKAKRFTVTFGTAGATSSVIYGNLKVYDRTRLIGTGTVRGGKGIVKLKRKVKLKKGKHTFRLVLSSSATSQPKAIRKSVKVK